MSGLLRVRSLCEQSELKARLVLAGLSALAAGEKAELFAACAKGLHNCGLDYGAVVRAFFVPGRIEVLGKHTDYAGGRSIVAAAENGFCMVAAEREDTDLRILDVAGGEQVEFTISGRLESRLGHWCNYPVTVARRLARNFPGPLRGADVAFASDLPRSAGMSSSSAMMVGYFLVLSGFNELASRKEYRSNIGGPEDVAGYLGAVENGQSFGTLAGDEGVGTFGGSEDHTAIVCCRAGLLSQYSYCPVRFERHVKFPSEYVFAVASSGVVAEKAGAAMEKYNRLSNLCRRAVEMWNGAMGWSEPHLAGVIASGPDASDGLRKVLQESGDEEYDCEELLQRFEHFLAESEQIVPAAGDALAGSDLAEFGRQVLRSQELAERLLGNQVAETVFLARSARELGAVAASAFGAGFGGGVWALTRSEKGEELLAEWSALYKSKFPEAGANAQLLLTRPGPAAFEL